MDDFKWTVFLESLKAKTLEPRVFALELMEGSLTPSQKYAVYRIRASIKGTIYGISLDKEILKILKNI